MVEFLAHEVVRAARAASLLPVSLGDVPPAGPDPFVRVDPCAYADARGDRPPAGALLHRPDVAADAAGRDRSVRGRAALRRTRPGRAPRGAWRSRTRGVVRGGLQHGDPRGAGRSRASCATTSAARSPPSTPRWITPRSPPTGPGARRDCSTRSRRRPARTPCCATRCRACSQPRHLRTVALTLWSVGWHPRSIAALVRARYEEPHDWGTHWQRHDPAGTAAFYVRLYCAAAACGLDDGLFTCETQARHALCPAGGCGYDLGVLFRRLRTLPRPQRGARMTTARPARARDPIDDRLSADAGVPADEVAVLRRALAGVLALRPDVRGAAVYPIAHGEAMVRLFTAHGWVPTLITRRRDRHDPAALRARRAAGNRAPPTGWTQRCARRRLRRKRFAIGTATPRILSPLMASHVLLLRGRSDDSRSYLRSTVRRGTASLALPIRRSRSRRPRRSCSAARPPRATGRSTGAGSP